eukprot:1897557-Amphidinium_carterae.1
MVPQHRIATPFVGQSPWRGTKELNRMLTFPSPKFASRYTSRKAVLSESCYDAPNLPAAQTKFLSFKAEAHCTASCMTKDETASSR